MSHPSCLVPCLHPSPWSSPATFPRQLLEGDHNLCPLCSVSVQFSPQSEWPVSRSRSAQGNPPLRVFRPPFMSWGASPICVQLSPSLWQNQAGNSSHPSHLLVPRVPRSPGGSRAQALGSPGGDSGSGQPCLFDLGCSTSILKGPAARGTPASLWVGLTQPSCGRQFRRQLPRQPVSGFRGR